MTKSQTEKIIELAGKLNRSADRAKFEKMALQIKMIFRKEEQLYKKYDHPDTSQHTKIHKELERVMASFEQIYFNKNKRTISTLNEFCLYIKNWTLLHYECYDTFMMPYIRISKFVQGER